MYKPVQSTRLYEQIVRQIERQIVAGELKVGDQLPPERELAQQFAVSRTVVREAVKSLSEKGLVKIHVGRGTFIANDTDEVVRQSLGLFMVIDSPKGILNMVEVREVMEPEIAALAAIRITEEYITVIREAYEKMETLQDDVDAFVEADLVFHLTLAEATQNPIILSLLDSVIDLLREQIKLTSLTVGGLQRGHSHHKELIEAICHHNASAAREAMRRHLEQIRKDSEDSPANAR